MLEQNGTKYGLIAGLGSIIFTLIVYLIDPKIMFNIGGWVNWIIFLFCMYKSVADDKKQDGGYITFRNAFQSAFVVSVIASFLQTVFFYVLITIIDTGLMDLQLEMAEEAFLKIAEMMNFQEEQITEGLNAISETGDVTLVKTVQGYLFGLIGWAIPALIIAAIMKKDKPLQMESSDNNDIDHFIENN